MADPTELTLDALHQAVTDAIKAQFPSLATVEFYREDRKGLTTPACLLDISEFEHAPDDDLGTGQMPWDARFEAEIVLDFRTPEAKLAARKLATALGSWLRMRRWAGIHTGAAHVIGCYKDDFKSELDQYEVWRVEWHQVIHLGVNELADDGTVIIPTEILGSWMPDIGLAGKDKYVPLEVAAQDAQP